MDIRKLLSELRQERDILTETIMRLERLNHGLPRRGRPPAWLKAARAASEPLVAPSPRRKRQFSLETREQMAKAQRRRWEAIRKQATEE